MKINSSLPHDYNCFFNNKDEDYIYWAPYGTHDLKSDPCFADSLFNLKRDSPCIDAGIDMGLPYYRRAPDIGANETNFSFELLKDKIPEDSIKDTLKKE